MTLLENAIFHDSYDEAYRKPFGAVSCGETVSLAVTVDNSEQVRTVRLHVYTDGDQQSHELPMECVLKGEQRSRYEVMFSAPECPQLLWYFFVLEKHDACVYYGNASQKGGIGGVTAGEQPPGYQITVYDRTTETPQWYKHAVMYQIFVDRFFNGNEHGRIDHPKKNSVLHAHWDNDPYYIRDVKTGHVVRWDFFGGNLLGVMKKLPYLQHLGVSVLYLNPIFEAVSNHKYDTGDYHKIDPMFGDNELFRELCERAAEAGIKLILDGVFSHTGSDSKYFNREGNYDSLGAYQSKESPYFHWYRFTDYPHEYESWWGVDVLPNVNEMESTYMKFIIDNPNSVISHWLKMGAAGWRLDVADELPDEFIKKIRRVMKRFHKDTVLIGEVWEDATNKVSYGSRRDYLLGSSLDSVMNYPFRVAVLDFLTGKQTAKSVYMSLMSLFENYPREYFYSNMNILGTHDTARLLTSLDGDEAKMKLAVLWQMTFPGVPCVYYGDEAGLVGGEDPMNRKTYPWGKENDRLIRWYHTLIAVRNMYNVFQTGSFIPFFAGDSVLGYIRQCGASDEFANTADALGNQIFANMAIVIINADAEASQHVNVNLQTLGIELNEQNAIFYDVLANYREIRLINGTLSLQLPPQSAVVCVADRWARKDVERRQAGVLLHLSSLPSRYGIGDMGEEALRFADFLHAGKQTLWQMLPLNPLGYGNSPYQCDSAFAGNFLFIDLEQLVEEGVLFSEELEQGRVFSDSVVDYDAVARWKMSMLRKAYRRYRHRCTGKQNAVNINQEFQPCEEFRQFEQKHVHWLEDYGLYSALKGHFSQPWVAWDESLRVRVPDVMKKYRELLKEEIAFVKYTQFVFYKQWERLSEYCRTKGIQLIGDVPIYVAHDSCDVWANQDLFLLNEQRYPTSVAGVPPDYFCETGQLWGNPLYDWQMMKQDRYAWWMQRLAHMQSMFDVVRIDHFRAFADYWSIPSDKVTAVDGIWKQGPGEDFFREARSQLGAMRLIAEDLGILSRQAKDLTIQTGYPGMSVLQFEMDADKKQAFPLPLYRRNTVVYTGTHDNDTVLGWYGENQTESQNFVCTLNEKDEICWTFIEKVYGSDAELVVIPLQDILCKGTEARMNVPGTVTGNWTWRVLRHELTEQKAQRLAEFAVLFKRANAGNC